MKVLAENSGPGYYVVTTTAEGTKDAPPGAVARIGVMHSNEETVVWVHTNEDEAITLHHQIVVDIELSSG